MAFQSIKGGLWIPHHPPFFADPALSNTLTIDAAAERFALILAAPKTGTLDKFEFLVAAVASPANWTLRASFQGVDASGDPDGTQDQFRDLADPASNTWVVPGLMTSDGTDGGTKRSVTVGEIFACVVEFSAWVTTGSVIGNSLQLNYPSGMSGLPYGDLFTASWAKQQRPPCLALKYDDGSYEFIPGVWPILASNTTTFNSGSSPDERGLYFSFPFPCKVSGAWVRADIDNAADIVLYDSNGTTALETIALASANRVLTASLTYAVRFSQERQLTASTSYRLVLKPGASSVSMFDFDVSAAALMDAVEGGQAFHSTTRTDAGAWTQVTTKRPWMGLLVNSFDDAVGGASGLVRHPGMAGGLSA